MRLSESDGLIELSPGLPPITAELRLAQFEKSALALDAALVVDNGPHRSFALAKVLGAGWRSTLFFHDDALAQVSLCDAGPRFGTTWDDSSMEKEHARKSAHDQHLADWGVTVGRHPWGDVSSTFDPRGGASLLIVSYRR